MGIDRKDVRIVCHFNIPKSMESFYQESGRAGRDQLPCRSLLYYGIDDRKRMEFILRNPKDKKSESSADGSSKKPLDDFIQMVEYCEGSGCRRKKILESFGEQAPTSLCAKSCDSCKQPSLVANQLTQLTSYTTQRKHLISQVFTNSSSNNADGAEFSEFWNRNDDEPHDSEEEISDSDDDAEALKSLGCASSRSRSRLSEKFDILQRAEEKYYQNRMPQKQTGRTDKILISDTLRESSKQRLLNAIKETQQRLGSLNVDLDSAVSLLENECYNKYGKSGKSFYISQMASTVRWLSSATLVDVTKRLHPYKPNHEHSKQKDDSDSPPEPPSSKVNSTQAVKEQFPEHPKIEVRVPSTDRASGSSEQKIKLPPVPSFSDFVRNEKAKGSRSTPSSENKRSRLS
ncbi:hypothetical protein vseg_000666 [Gypsophila vaccaria]